MAFAAGPGPQETVKLLLGAVSLLCGLPLEDAPGPDLTLSADDLLNRADAKGADQLLLQVGGAHVETGRFHIGARQARAIAGPLQSAPEKAFLGGITQASQPNAEPARAEQMHEAGGVGRASHRHDGNAVATQSPAAPLSQRLERGLVTYPLDKDDRPRPGNSGQIEVHDR